MTDDKTIRIFSPEPAEAPVDAQKLGGFLGSAKARSGAA